MQLQGPLIGNRGPDSQDSVEGLRQDGDYKNVENKGPGKGC